MINTKVVNALVSKHLTCAIRLRSTGIVVPVTVGADQNIRTYSVHIPLGMNLLNANVFVPELQNLVKINTRTRNGVMQTVHVCVTMYTGARGIKRLTMQSANVNKLENKEMVKKL